MLSILHRYVLWELVRSFVISFAALTGMMLLGSLYKPLRLGVGPDDLARLIPLVLPHLYSWVIPAALLSACVMAYGRLSADNELKAICGCGVPLRYVCYPALVLGLVLTTLAIPLNDWLVPHSALLRERELRRIFFDEPFRISLLGSQITTKIGGYKIYVESVEGNTLRNVVVIEPKGTERLEAPRKRHKAAAEASEETGPAAEEGDEVNVYRAERATYSVDRARRRMRIVLYSAQCVMVLPGRSARQWVEITAAEQVKDIPVADVDANLERRSNMTTAQLLQRARDYRLALAAGHRPSGGSRKEFVRDTTEVRLREALAFATLALCCVGVPLGVWMQRQSRLASFAVGIAVFFALYAMIVGGEGLAMEQRMPPWLALWTPDALVAALGLGLLLRTFRH
ncbi:MAG TPA: LptF/LptG family permease [Planctomycetota bacterium]|nr:LptF/LptG family permease [Planctomycetota bacterium]